MVYSCIAPGASVTDWCGLKVSVPVPPETGEHEPKVGLSCLSTPPGYDAFPLDSHHTPRADTTTKELVAAKAVIA